MEERRTLIDVDIQRLEVSLEESRVQGQGLLTGFRVHDAV